MATAAGDRPGNAASPAGKIAVYRAEAAAWLIPIHWPGWPEGVAVMRTRTSFQKRQKEIARAEKQRDKIAKRQQKKLAPKQPIASAGNPDDRNDADAESEPSEGSETRP